MHGCEVIITLSETLLLAALPKKECECPHPPLEFISRRVKHPALESK